MSSKDEEFPSLKNDRILRAAAGQLTREIPIWIMRQAGRYLPEFRELREKHEFLEICKTPELSCQVTLQPLQRFQLDAAIIFSDILVVVEALGLQVEMNIGSVKGPSVLEPIREPVDLERVCKKPDVRQTLDYVMKAITLTRHRLDGACPLIGFAGAPWTLFCYLVEGHGSTNMTYARKFIYKWPADAHALLSVITDCVAEFCVAQVEAGAQLIQLFDSHAGHLGPDTYLQFSGNYLASVAETVRKRLEELEIDSVPLICFAKGVTVDGMGFLGDHFDVLSFDWTWKPEHCLVIGRKGKRCRCVQGNLDPAALYADETHLVSMTSRLLRTFAAAPAPPSSDGADGSEPSPTSSDTPAYIFNLGHGVYPDFEVDNVAALIRTVNEFRRAVASPDAAAQADGDGKTSEDSKDDN